MRDYTPEDYWPDAIKRLQSQTPDDILRPYDKMECAIHDEVAREFFFKFTREKFKRENPTINTWSRVTWSG